MIGLPNDFSQTNATPDDLRQWIMSFYAQDTFQISPRFTLNFGVRWEPTFSDPDKYGRGTSFSRAGFDAGQFSNVYPNAPAGLFFKGDPGIPDAMWNGQYGELRAAPGSGLESARRRPRHASVSAAAILYDVTETWFNERETTNAPIGTNIDTPNPVGGLSNPWQGYPGGNPFPQNGKAFFPTAGVYVNMPINPKPTYVANWNVTYQRQLPGSWMVSVSYLGNKTTHLWSGNGEVNPARLHRPGNCVAGSIRPYRHRSVLHHQQRELPTCSLSGEPHAGRGLREHQHLG